MPQAVYTGERAAATPCSLRGCVTGFTRSRHIAVTGFVECVFFSGNLGSIHIALQSSIPDQLAGCVRTGSSLPLGCHFRWCQPAVQTWPRSFFHVQFIVSCFFFFFATCLHRKSSANFRLNRK